MTPKKSLGQHFLTNRDIVSSIVDAAELSPEDTVLEIGPGKGILTEELLKRGSLVVAVEKDADLIPFLGEKFEKEIKNKRLTLIQEDILDFNPQKHGLRAGKYKLVANIPYYITGLIFRKFLTTPTQPQKIVLLVQKEVAERIVARNKKESLLSVGVKVYGTPIYIKTVKAGAFTPAPKVDSAILSISAISRQYFTDISEEKFFEVLHAGFAHKRKQISGNLEPIFGKQELLKRLQAVKISEKARAEDLTLENWLSLAAG